MSNKAFSADNQQGSPRVNIQILPGDPSEAIRRAPLLKKVLKAYLLGALHDGTFSSHKRFRISQKGKEWLEILQGFFKQVGYKSWIDKTGKIHNPSAKLDPNHWRMYILANSHKLFVRKIASWHPRRIITIKKRMKIWSMPYSDIGVT